jgi:uncharacterized membrane protein
VFAIIAAILFGVALLLDLLDTAGDIGSTLITAGLLFLALELARPVVLNVRSQS